jgi:hypothetical protein
MGLKALVLLTVGAKMVRSAAAVLAVLILPNFALAQEAPGTHTVVKDDTLWDLAQRYYSNPFEWRVIWEANQEVVEDPNWIYPAEVIVIPGLPGDPAADDPGEEDPTDPVEGDPTEAGDDPGPDVQGVPIDLIPFGLRQARPTDQTRTIFYDDTETERATFAEGREVQYLPVSQDAVYSAPWLIGLEGDPESDGYIAGFADRGTRASSIRSFDQVSISMPAPARVGARLQLYRVDRVIEDIGQVVVPTGVVTVSTLGDGEVVGVVTKEYDRIQPGDLVRPLPSYAPEAGTYAEEVSGGSEAMVMGFAGNHVLTDIGHIAFLDLGSDDGVVIGDEFILYGDAIPTARDGSLQVIGVTETMAAARVLSMTDNVFRQGVVVRLAKKMR